LAGVALPSNPVPLLLEPPILCLGLFTNQRRLASSFFSQSRGDVFDLRCGDRRPPPPPTATFQIGLLFVRQSAGYDRYRSRDVCLAYINAIAVIRMRRLICDGLCERRADAGHFRYGSRCNRRKVQSMIFKLTRYQTTRPSQEPYPHKPDKRPWPEFLPLR
jgi:hypothetical protein